MIFLGGGKFKNGAVTGAFASLLYSSSIKKSAGFNSGEEAARDRLTKINPASIAEDREYAGLIYKTDEGYFATPGIPGDFCGSGAACSSSPFDALSMVPSDATITGIFHTHGAAPNHTPEMFSNFSPHDVGLIPKLYKDYGIKNSYLATPQGNMLLDLGNTIDNDNISLGHLPRLK